MNKTVKIEAKLLAEILQRLEALKEFAALYTGNGAGHSRIFFDGNVDNVTGDEFHSNLEASVKETTDFLQRLDAARWLAVRGYDSYMILAEKNTHGICHNG